jgi:hypothetical protein
MAWKLGKNTDGRTPDLIEIDYANGDTTPEITQGDLITSTAGVFSVTVTAGEVFGIAMTEYHPPTLQDVDDYIGLVLPITTETEIEADLTAAVDPATITPYDAYDISGATINAAASVNGDFIVTRIGKLDYATGDALTVFGYFVNANGSRK